MIRKRLVLASYPLGYLGLALFLRWVVWLHYNSGIDNNLTKILLVLGSLVLLMLVSFGIGSSYFEIMFESFPKEVQRKCKVFFSYLDRVSLILFVGFGTSILFGETVYVQLTKILLYFALGFYISSSAVILLFTHRK